MNSPKEAIIDAIHFLKARDMLDSIDVDDLIMILEEGLED